MITSTASSQRFVRRTSLQPGEYRTNFRQIDCDVIASLTSDEASQVTQQMSKIYLSLINAPSQYWEHEGVLHFAGCEREGKWLTAWEQLVALVGVASATAHKAFQWMAEQAVIGYYAGKNGVGIRIFINRAASSIGQKPSQAQKNLRLIHTSTTVPRTSTVEVGFKGSSNIDNLELDFIPHAPKGGAAEINTNKKLAAPEPIPQDACIPIVQVTTIDSDAIVERIAREVLPQIKSAAAREHERTREWFINNALPKAIRVAQRSAYDILRAKGAINEPRARGSNSERAHSNSRDVGKHIKTEIAPRQLDDQEIKELAMGCLALLETQGQTIEQTLSEMSVEAGGFLLPEDALRLRIMATDLTLSDRITQGHRREN